MLDYLFRNATIVDGSGHAAYRGDLAVENGRIAGIGHLEGAQAATVLDLAGKVLAPGFIDVHVHSEMEMLAGRHTAGVAMGVTTELICPDGMSFAPLPPAWLAEYRRYLCALYGDAAVGWDWQSFPEYLARFEGRIANNVAAQVPHGVVRLAVKGWTPGPASEEELAAMARLVREDLEAGAVGLNTGLEYVPATHSDLQELVALSRVVAEYGGVYAAHMRGTTAQGLAETVAVAEQAGVPVHISHFSGAPAGQYQAVEAALARGIDLTWDSYPYCAGCTMLAIGLPPSMLAVSIDQLLADLQTPEMRRRTHEALESRFPPDSPVYFAALARPHNQWMEGRRLRQVWEGSGKTFEDFVCDLLVDEELAPLLILPWPDSPEAAEARLRYTLTHPRQMVSTDGIYRGRYAHPRSWGTYPRLLGRYVREQGWLGLEDAVRRMSGFPAARFDLADRGLLRPGLAADLVVFDPATIQDQGTYESPRLAPVGIEHVLVNGTPVVWQGRLTAERPGRLVRRGGR